MMNAKCDPKDIADQLSGDVTYMQTLLGAAQDKVQLYLSNRHLLGPCEELLFLQARELDDLLALAERFLERIDGELETATDLLYQIEQPPAA